MEKMAKEKKTVKTLEKKEEKMISSFVEKLKNMPENQSLKSKDLKGNFEKKLLEKILEDIY
jgi:hypothetical protein